MKQRYYIWYVIYVNGEYCGRGRYPTSYAHKSSAIRRAKRMWSTDFRNEITGDVVHREWTVLAGVPHNMTPLEVAAACYRPPYVFNI